MTTKNEVEKLIFSTLEKKHGSSKVKSLNTEDNLIQTGLLDSLDFISLLMEIEELIGVSLDFEDIDPSEISSIKGLINLADENEQHYA